MIYRLARPLLFLLPPEPAHRLAFTALKLARPVLPLARPVLAPRRKGLERELLGLRFPNPLGLAAGLDKEAELAEAWPNLGFGFMELGTLTPKPQPGNPKPRVFRVPQSRALINRMGFNNGGVEAAAHRLRHLKKTGRWPACPVGVSIGKNKLTPNELAAEDYLACVRALGSVADYLAINISSPNTPGLRSLQEPAALRGLIQVVSAAAGSVPVLVKLAPDLEDSAFDQAVDVALEGGARGLIVTNTTLSREGLLPGEYPEGGLSGAPLFERSTRLLARAAARVKGRAVLMASGGVMGAEDVARKLDAGADLVQAYTGFIYGGPMFCRQALKGVAAKK